MTGHTQLKYVFVSNYQLINFK